MPGMKINSMLLNQCKQTSLIRLFFFSLITFLYLFNIKFLAASWMPTGRLVFLGMLVFYGVNSSVFLKKEIARYPLYFILLLFVLLYVVVQSFLIQQTDFSLISKMIVFCVFSLFMAAMSRNFFPSIQLFLQSIALACLLQAIMVYISFFSPEYRNWLSLILVESSNIPLTNGSRVPGFSNSSGSALSLILSLGVFSLMSLYYCTSKPFQRFTFLFGSIFILLSCIFVGKLGLFLSIYFIISILILESIRRPIFAFKILIIGTITLFFLMKYTFVGDLGQFTYVMERSFALFMGNEDSTLTALKSMPIPALDVNTMIGYGITTDAKGINAAHSDVGYIQTYYALGFIFSLIFYTSLFFYLLVKAIAVKDRPYRLLSFVLFIPLFIIELKEPFITKLGYSFVIFSFLFIVNKTSKYSFRSSNAHLLRQR